MFRFVVSQLLVWHFLFAIVSCDPLLVQTKGGQVKGVLQETFLNKKQYISYKGIPYAEPPVGDLRFKVATPSSPWSGVLETTNVYRNCCIATSTTFPQDLLPQNEDCLYLNVYTPILDEEKQNKKLAVMFYIHGGSFTEGDGSDQYYGADFVMEDDVVLVTINYRLGIFGFCNFEQPGYTGNMGFKDQQLALNWTKNNIENFGGDPDLITVIGQSAGGASTHLQVLNADSRKLIKRAVAMSGNAFNYLTHYEPNNHLDLLRSDFATELGSQTSGQEVLAFFKNASVDLIVEKISTWDQNNGVVSDYWSAVVENATIAERPFLTQRPHEIYETTEIDTEVLFGTTSAEFLVVFSIASQYYWYDGIKNYTTAGLPYHGLTLSTSSEVYMEKKKEIVDFYLGSGEIEETVDNVDKWTQMISDTNFVVPFYESIKLHSKHADTSCYHLNLNLSLNYFKILYDMEDLNGTAHLEDIPYLFKSNLFDDLYNKVVADPTDSQNAKTINAWNFVPSFFTGYAKNGSTQGLSSINGDDFRCAHITNDGLESMGLPNKKAMEFWDGIYESVKSYIVDEF